MLNGKRRPMLMYTLGPASLECAPELFRAGANAVRLTFSFGSARLQETRARALRSVAAELGCPCIIVADLAGEKPRLGTFSTTPSIPVHTGDAIQFFHGSSGEPSQPGHLLFPVTNDRFLAELTVGAIVVVGDGAVNLLVKQTQHERVECQALTGGVIDQTRGLTVQGAPFVPRALTEKDLGDLDSIAGAGVFDMVALSFVSDPHDVRRARAVLRARSCSACIIAKIETSSGIGNLDAIGAEADMIMAARGDLALAMPWTELPDAMDRIATVAKAHGKPWILATQLMEGLERFSMPLRPEICDLAHWLQRGADGVLLSYETAFGTHPVGAVEATSRMLKRWWLPS